MPDKKNVPKRPDAATEPQTAQQKAVDDAVDDSFPASDPPAWTTTGAKSVAARREDEAVDDVRASKEATAATERRGPDAKAAVAERPARPDLSSDSPKRQGDKLSNAVRAAAKAPEVEDEP